MFLRSLLPESLEASYQSGLSNYLYRIDLCEIETLSDGNEQLIDEIEYGRNQIERSALVAFEVDVDVDGIRQWSFPTTS